MLTLESWSTGRMEGKCSVGVRVVPPESPGKEESLYWCACVSGIGVLREPEKEAAVQAGPVLHSDKGEKLGNWSPVVRYGCGVQGR